MPVAGSSPPSPSPGSRRNVRDKPKALLDDGVMHGSSRHRRRGRLLARPVSPRDASDMHHRRHLWSPDKAQGARRLYLMRWG